MKLLASAAIAAAASLSIAASAWASEPHRLVILHTNDTHSQIDPDSHGRGGVARRKVLIDSVRAAEPAVMLVDAGDAVQGSLFFTLFRGEVEDSLMNLLGYDIQILGNHEFDNGTAELARRWSRLGAERLTTNYDLRAVAALDSLFAPYSIRRFGNKSIGFIALNLDPAGMIAAQNSEGVVYLDPVEAANATAWHLRHNERTDYVVALTHLGYASRSLANDLDLARRSRNIDVIIGGHSHTSINPADPSAPTFRVANADGDTVLIAQNGKGGATLGEVTIDFDADTIVSRLIAVDARLDSRADPAVEELLRPYRHSIDSLTSIVVASTPAELPHRSPALVNLVSDMVAAEGSALIGRPVDLAIMNKGGIRCGMPQGPVTRGLVMQMLPFDNRLVVLAIKGADLAEAFDVMASRGGDGVSSGVKALFDPESRRCTSITIAGEPIDPDRIYTLATIDYLADGGDYMTPLTRATTLAREDDVVYDALSRYLERHPAIVPDPAPRMSASSH